MDDYYRCSASVSALALVRANRPRDANRLANRIVDLSTGEADEEEQSPEDEAKDPAAVALDRKDGER